MATAEVEAYATTAVGEMEAAATMEVEAAAAAAAEIAAHMAATAKAAEAAEAACNGGRVTVRGCGSDGKGGRCGSRGHDSQWGNDANGNKHHKQ